MKIGRSVARAEFEDWIHLELAAIGESVDRLLAITGTDGNEIGHVFLTGGSAFVPAVRQLFADRFGEAKVAGGAEFTSDATGLALRAARGFER